MKKLISTVLSVIFLLSILHISAFALTFSDADYGDTNLNAALERLTDSGIIMGDDTGTFRPFDESTAKWQLFWHAPTDTSRTRLQSKTAHMRTLLLTTCMNWVYWPQTQIPLTNPKK